MSILTDEDKRGEKSGSPDNSQRATSASSGNTQPPPPTDGNPSWLSFLKKYQKFIVGIALWLVPVVLFSTIISGFVGKSFLVSLLIGWGLIVLTIVHESVPAKRLLWWLGLGLLVLAGVLWYISFAIPADRYKVGPKPAKVSEISFSAVAFNASDKLRLEMSKVAAAAQIYCQFGIDGGGGPVATRLIGDRRIGEITAPKGSKEAPLAVFLQDGKEEFECTIKNISSLSNGVDKLASLQLPKSAADVPSTPNPSVASAPAVATTPPAPTWENATDGSLKPKLLPGESLNQNVVLVPNTPSAWIIVPSGPDQEWNLRFNHKDDIYYQVEGSDPILVKPDELIRFPRIEGSYRARFLPAGDKQTEVFVCLTRIK